MCCGCRARPLKEENLVNGGVFRRRQCTDCLMVPFFAAFVVGWVVILIVAVKNGDPERILKPTNYRGEVCGDGDLKDFPNLYVPLANRPTYGICVPSCPKSGDYVCNTDFEAPIAGASGDPPVRNSDYAHTKEEFEAGAAALVACNANSAGCSTSTVKNYAALLVKLRDFKCFPALYSSSTVLHRCLPTAISDKAKDFLKAQGEAVDFLGKISEDLGIGNFFSRGISEIEQTWRVIAICAGSAAIVSLIWLLLLRFLLAPLVYLSLLAVFGGLLAVGVLAYFRAEDLSDSKLPGDAGASEQVTVWRIIAFSFIAAAAVFLIVVLVLLKNIRISMVLIKESSRALVANPGMVLIPPITMLVLLAVAAGSIVAALYIQTMGEFEKDTITKELFDVDVALPNTISTSLQSVDNAYSTAYTAASTAFNNALDVSKYDADNVIKGFHAYNAFGFLWLSSFCVMFGFFVMAMVVVSWYFSATGAQVDSGTKKHTGAGTLCKAFWAAIRYHLGTILLGSLLIAIIQFIRAVVLYLERHYLSKWKEMSAVKAVLCCLNCCLKCIEYVIKVISKSAFVIVCIKNNSFCTAACEALGLMVGNMIRTGVLLMLAAATIFVLKLFIVASNTAIAYGLLQIRELTAKQKVESMLFPLVVVAIISLLVASVFMNVFDTCIHTVMMCYFVDDKELEGRYMPPALAKVVGKFKLIEEARRKYKQELMEAEKTE